MPSQTHVMFSHGRTFPNKKLVIVCLSDRAVDRYVRLPWHTIFGKMRKCFNSVVVVVTVCVPVFIFIEFWKLFLRRNDVARCLGVGEPIEFF